MATQMKKERYIVYQIDVWAGLEEGEFEKNDFFKIAEIDLKEGFTKADIMRALRKNGCFLKTRASSLRIEDYNGDGEYIEVVNAKTGFPYLDLKRIED